MKGQKSLEMVIGLVILLVVAGTVISVFLGQFENTPGDEFESEVELQEIERQCESTCNDFADRSGIESRAEAVQYCTQRFSADITGSGDTRDVAGSLYNSYCEDGIHCFNVHECSVGPTTLNADGCEDIIYEYYTVDLGMDSSEAEDEIVEWYSPDVNEGDRGIGSCGLDEVEDETWWHVEFKDDYDFN